MQSEKSETIRMLCMLPKEMLTMRLNDDREFAVEREVMSKLK